MATTKVAENMKPASITMQNVLPIKGDLLVEHFAQLAADAAGVTMAVVTLFGGRRDSAATMAAVGLTREQCRAITEIDSALASDPVMTVVSDLARDQRFNLETSVANPLRAQFLCHVKLLSSDKRRIGFICVFDGSPRSNLTERQAASLGHVANMIQAYQKRNQRHLHLMHVANRALRVEKMLRLASDATSCADAMTHLLEELCRFHGAAVGRIWQQIRPDGPIVAISRYNQDDGVHGAPSSNEEPARLEGMIADAIRQNKPHAISLANPDSPSLVQEALADGVASQLCIPIWVQQQRFGISLAFSGEHSDLAAVSEDVASLADTIRPTLFQKVTEERIRFVALHDDLTQLSNRLQFRDHLEKALADARNGEHGFALLCLDLDGFKLVNDTRGHSMGDKLLVAVAQRLRGTVRDGDTVARMGGDEFAIIQPSSSQPDAAMSLARRLLDVISEPFELEGQRSVIGVSIGIALYPRDGDCPELLLQNADTALYQAKEGGRNTHRFFNAEMQVRQQERFLIEQDLKVAIEEKHFTLAYQPVCDSRSLQIVGFEALLRWNHRSRGVIPPDQFVPFAESSGMIVPLGQWALESACAEAAKWDPSICLSVNLSPRQFRQPDLPRQIADILERTGMPAERLDLEVTEGLLLDASDIVLRTMQSLKEQGIRITLDDFGTAYASLNYLRRFPFDRIKIDKSFVRGICGDESTLAIVQAILSLGEQLNLAVVAEGVETEHQLELLRNLGCRLVQGFLLGRPRADTHAHALLERASHQAAPHEAVTAAD